MMAEIWKRQRLGIRGLGEHAHYRIPLWRDLLEACGMVRGTRDNVRALMRDRQTVLVFPGGAREVNKRRGEKCRLIWKEGSGSRRCARRSVSLSAALTARIRARAEAHAEGRTPSSMAVLAAARGVADDLALAESFGFRSP